MAAWTPGWDAFPQPLLDFWTERHLCSLTTLRPDGRPHVVPVGVALDHENACAWVITSGSSRKVRNLLAAESDASARGGSGSLVAACAVDGARWSTLEGRARVLHDPASVARAVECYAARYRQPRVNPARVAIRIEVSRFVGSAGLLDA